MFYQRVRRQAAGLKQSCRVMYATYGIAHPTQCVNREKPGVACVLFLERESGHHGRVQKKSLPLKTAHEESKECGREMGRLCSRPEGLLLRRRREHHRAVSARLSYFESRFRKLPADTPVSVRTVSLTQRSMVKWLLRFCRMQICFTFSSLERLGVSSDVQER